MGNYIKPLKGLGQHFLEDASIAEKIVESLIIDPYYCPRLLEIGPGLGVLTSLLVNKPVDLYCIEVDDRSVRFLLEKFPSLKGRIMYDDYLTSQLKILEGNSYAVIGNFPYNISSQILFRILDDFEKVPQVTGMFQKEVAQRITAAPGSKVYGIPSVLLQAYYDCEYLFTVPPGAFNPPPKVESGVIRLLRKKNHALKCDASAFKRVVKTGFNQRRKTLRNSLRSLLPVDQTGIPYLDLRPEQLHFTQFEELVLSFIPE